MNKPIQIITTPAGEKLVVLPEDEYLTLLAAAEEDEDLQPDVLTEIQRRREAARNGGETIPFDELRKPRNV
jgi:hypothetical protein